MKLTCTIEEEIRDYIRNHDELRYLGFIVTQRGFFYCRDNKIKDSVLFSPFCDSEKIMEILRWHRIEIKIRGELCEL